jgi:hypothetical protein
MLSRTHTSYFPVRQYLLSSSLPPSSLPFHPNLIPVPSLLLCVCETVRWTSRGTHYHKLTYKCAHFTQKSNSLSGIPERDLKKAASQSTSACHFSRGVVDESREDRQQQHSSSTVAKGAKGGAGVSADVQLSIEFTEQRLRSSTKSDAENRLKEVVCLLRVSVMRAEMATRSIACN